MLLLFNLKILKILKKVKLLKEHIILLKIGIILIYIIDMLII